MASSSSGGHSTQLSELVRRLKQTKRSWERGEGPEPDDPQFRELVDNFKELSDIREMNLVGEDLGDTIISAMGRAMIEVLFPHLTSLQLGGNYVTEVGIRSVAKAIEFGHLPALESLGLFPPREGNERSRFLRLEEANWIRNLVKDEGVKILASAFASGHASALKVLTLEQNGFATHGAIALAEVIQAKHLPSLEVINLSYNDVGDEGIIALAKAFEECGHLKVLDLETCNIYVGGTRALAAALMSGNIPALTELYLGDNNTSLRDPREASFTPVDEGLLELAKVLQERRLPKLQLLDLGPRSGTSRKVAEAFRNAYRSNDSLVLTLKMNWSSYGSYENSVRRLRERNEGLAMIKERLQGEEDVQATNGKIFLCGHPEQGKTTLRRTLQREFSTKKEKRDEPRTKKEKRDEPRTRGIEVSHIVSKATKLAKSHIVSKATKLAIWDLAGQEEYHVLHSAFLPDLAFADGQATTFVVVCNAKYPGSEVGSDHHGRQLPSYWMRFIASSSLKGEDRGKRHVVVVLNCFNGESCEYLDRWETYLRDLKKLFHDYLEIEERPFVLDARSARKVRPLREHLIQHTREKLEAKRVPKLCQFIQDRIPESVRKGVFPIVPWVDFARQFQSSESDEQKLKAAVDYLHESGHLIHFRKGWEGHINERSAGPGRSLVVIDPDWFCRGVVGDLLLPDKTSMLVDGEYPLTRRVLSDGSIALPDLKYHFRHLGLEDEQQVSDIMAMLLRLGICYMAGNQRVLIPALISDKVVEGNQNPRGLWGHSRMLMMRDQWVMGYCLKVQDNMTTLLPIGAFRRLQVELAQDPMCTAADSEYTARKFTITFGTNGMAVLVEFSANEEDPNLEGRIDFLVWPLVSRDQDRPERRRELQVELANLIVEKFVSLAETWSPGVDFERLVVKPWCTAEGMLLMKDRIVTMSVEGVKRVLQEGETETAWIVNDEPVNLIDLLSGQERRHLRMLVVRDQWVMGYCLKVQHNMTTLLPVAVFRRLQVELAQDPMCTAADFEYTARKVTITLGMNGMAVLVEFSADEEDPDLEDRVDILVWPLVSRDQDCSERRRELQVELANLIVEKFVSLVETWSPGVDFEHLVVKPWCTAEGMLLMKDRIVALSVEGVKRLLEVGETQIAWIVNDEPVKLIDLLSGREQRQVESSIGEKQADYPSDHSGKLRRDSLGPDEEQILQKLVKHIDVKLKKLDKSEEDILYQNNDQGEYENGEKNEESVSKTSGNEEFQFRSDIQNLGLTSWDCDFNPSHILALGDVTNVDGQVHFIFFHVEAMANLFGVGLPYSKISISLNKQEILIEEMEEETWKKFWMISYTGPFRPFLFGKIESEMQENLEENVFHLDKGKALSNLGIIIDGPQSQKYLKLDQATEKSIKWEPTWKGWIKGLIDHVGASKVTTNRLQDRVQALTIGPPSGTTSIVKKKQALVEQPSQDATPRFKGEVNAGTKQDEGLVVNVTFVCPDCPFFSFTGDRETAKKIIGREATKRIIGGREGLPERKSFIKPFLTMKFFRNLRSKEVSATLDVQYQMGCQAETWPAGWFQDYLRLSFGSNDGSRQNLQPPQIISEIQHVDAENVMKSGTSTSYQRGGNVEGAFQASLPVLCSANGKASGQLVTADQFTQNDESRLKPVLQVLKDDALFRISNKSIDSMMEYEACFWPTEDPSNYFKGKESKYSEARFSGLQSNLGIKVEATWDLFGNETHEYDMEASKKLSKCTESKTEEILQIFRRKFIVNHDFSQFFDYYKKQFTYDWMLLDESRNDAKPSPVPRALDKVGTSSSGNVGGGVP